MSSRPLLTALPFLFIASAFVACSSGKTNPRADDAGVGADGGDAGLDSSANEGGTASETAEGFPVPLVLSATEPLVVEEGSNHALTLTLTTRTKVKELVDVKLSSSIADVTFDPPVVRFGPDLPESVSVKVTVKSDESATGDRIARIRATNAILTSELAAFHDDALDVEIYDDDTPGIRVLVTTPPATYEDPTALPVTLQVRLASPPSDNVTLPVSVSDATEAGVSVASLTFGPTNWRTPQAVGVRGLRDGVVDRDVEYDVLVGPPDKADARYARLAAASVRLTNVDEDRNALRVVGIDYPGGADELGSGGVMRVSLAARPTSPVYVPVRAADNKKVAVECGDLVLDEKNWQQGAECTVHGVTGDKRTSGVAFTSVDFGPTRSEDPRSRDLTGSDSFDFEYADMPWRLAHWDAVTSGVESTSADGRFVILNDHGNFVLLDRSKGTRTQLPLPQGVKEAATKSAAVSNDGLVALAGDTGGKRFVVWTVDATTGASRPLDLGTTGLSGDTFVAGIATDGHSLLLLTAATELVPTDPDEAIGTRGTFWLDLRTPGAKPVRVDPRASGDPLPFLHTNNIAMSGNGNIVAVQELVFDATTGRTGPLGCWLTSSDYRRIDHEGRRVLCGDRKILDRTNGALSSLLPVDFGLAAATVVSAQGTAWFGTARRSLASGFMDPTTATKYPLPSGIIGTTPLWVSDDGKHALVWFFGRGATQWIAELEAR